MAGGVNKAWLGQDFSHVLSDKHITLLWEIVFILEWCTLQCKCWCNYMAMRWMATKIDFVWVGVCVLAKIIVGLPSQSMVNNITVFRCISICITSHQAAGK